MSPDSSAITSFRGPYRFLSNFYRMGLVLDGAFYPSAEHAFQAFKAATPESHAYIQGAPNPRESKARGRQCVLRPEWADPSFRLAVMLRVLYAKFDHHTLRQQLLATGDRVLVEGNTWGDRYWGQCPIGQGQNHLGRLLMQVRQDLRRREEVGDE